MTAEERKKIDVFVKSCANCGIAEAETESDDAVKLESCPACHLVYYCSIKCQAEHRPKHKRDCKKREAELKDEYYDELLFKQPESSHHGDCPICFLPMPLSAKVITVCCIKHVCQGCDLANKKREEEEMLEQICPFCREPLAASEAECRERVKDRAKVNDPAALCQLGMWYRDDEDFEKAFVCFSKAVALGHMESNEGLASSYRGRGTERNELKLVFHYEKASIGGDPSARRNIGIFEWNHGQHERAVRHWIISAKQGDNESLKYLRMSYTDGLLSKNDYAAALRGHQAAVDAMKSPQREEAAIFWGHNGK